MYKATFNRSSEYLIHFNKNHSSKNGQFTSGDGDGDGIADDHKYAKNKRAIKLGWQNKDGTLTEKGKANLKAKRQYDTAARNLKREGNKLGKANKHVRDMVEDHEAYVEDIIDIAKMHGLDTKNLEKALKDFNSSNYEQASAGEAMCRRMSDVYVDYLNKKL